MSALPSDLEIYGYENEFAQTLLNIFNNAKDAFRDRPDGKREITIVAKEEGDWAVLQICDTAGGIPESILPKIFDPYFSTKEQGESRG